MTEAITTRPATEADAIDLAVRLCKPDLDAITAAFPMPPEYALKAMLSHGECQAVCIDGRPEAFFGCNNYPSRPDRGFPWFAASSSAFESEERIAGLIRVSQRLVTRWQERYTELVTMSDQRHTVYADWLALLGFTIMGQLAAAGGHLFNLYFKGGH